ncbi:unnamed protein product, partial [Phaeothamnion confervicola]
VKQSLNGRYLALSAAVVLAITGYSIFWFTLADRIETGIAGWAEARRAEGMIVEYSALSVTGFPLRVQIEAHDAHLAGPGPAPSWDWRSVRLIGNVLPYNINHIVLSLPEKQQIGIRINGGLLEQYQLVPLESRASVKLAGGKISRLDADISGGTLSGGRLLAGEMTLGRAQLHVRQVAAEADADGASGKILDVAIGLENINYPGFANSALGPQLARLMLNSSIEGEWPKAKGPDGVREWRDAGGVAQLAAIDVQWGPLNLKATGTVALDAQDRLIGSLTAKLSGYDNLIKGLQDAGQLSKDEAAAARAAFGLISMAAGDTKGELSLPLVAQDGEMYVGPLRIAKLKPLY